MNIHGLPEEEGWKLEIPAVIQHIEGWTHDHPALNLPLWMFDYILRDEVSLKEAHISNLIRDHSIGEHSRTQFATEEESEAYMSAFGTDTSGMYRFYECRYFLPKLLIRELKEHLPEAGIDDIADELTGEVP